MSVFLKKLERKKKDFFKSGQTNGLAVKHTSSQVMFFSGDQPLFRVLGGSFVSIKKFKVNEYLFICILPR